MEKKQKILIITGATASGKSDFAVNIAQKINGEIIGADSVQIYKGLDIGSGKITPSEMKGIRHHLIDILNPDDEYSVSDYVSAAKQKICEISNRGKIPIIVGGTGLYIKCLLEGHNFATAEKDDGLREKYKQLLLDKGKEYLYELLKKIDPISSEKISANDTKRVIRALEIYELTGMPKSAAAQVSAEYIFDFIMLVPSKERQQLYNAINQRVEKMFEAGLIDEVNSLIKYKSCQSLQSIGYKETIEYLEGQRPLEETKELIKLNTRHYAKRQLTFIRGMKCEKEWIDTQIKHITSDINAKLASFFE